MITRKRQCTFDMNDSGSGRNILLISIDTLRSDHVSAYGYQRDTTPFLDDYSEQNVRFTNSYSAGPGTSVSFPSIFSSTYPFDYGGYSGFADARQSFVEELYNAGYRTIGIHSNGYLSNSAGYGRGFSEYECFTDSSGNNPVTSLKRGLRSFVQGSRISKYISQIAGENGPPSKRPYQTASAVTDTAIEALQGAEDDVFLWAHYMDVHYPFFPIDSHEYVEEIDYEEVNNAYFEGLSHPDSLSREDLQNIRDVYDSEIRYVDSEIERLLSAVGDHRSDSDTLVLITSDHGEEFLEHGDIGHRPKVYEELIDVPMVFDHPEYEGGVVAENPVSHIDIAPTILEFAGIEIPESYRGRPLTRSINAVQDEDRPIFAEVCHTRGQGIDQGEFNEERMIIACRIGQYKLILNNQDGTEHLFDLRNDSEEQDPIDSPESDVYDRLRTAIQDHLDSLYAGTASPRSTELQESSKEQLRELGYIE